MINYNEDKYRPYEAEFRETNQQWMLTNRVYARSYLNNLDYWYNPTEGYFASQRFTVTGFLPFERQHYIKSETRLDAFATLFTIPLSDTWKFKWVLMGHSGFQTLISEPWTDFKVTKDWVSLDGTFNVRGWKSLYGSKGMMLWGKLRRTQDAHHRSDALDGSFRRRWGDEDSNRLAEYCR